MGVMSIDRETTRAISLPDAQLRSEMASYIPSHPIHVAASMELDRRARRIDFWRNGIVPWIALAVSILSLALSASALYWQHN